MSYYLPQISLSETHVLFNGKFASAFEFCQRV